MFNGFEVYFFTIVIKLVVGWFLDIVDKRFVYFVEFYSAIMVCIYIVCDMS
jgi:hypothetical protein